MAARIVLRTAVKLVTAGLLIPLPLLRAEDTRVNPKDGLTYVRIPAGSYVMGCAPSDKECYEWESKPTEVQIAKEFWIGRTEVPQKAYQFVMGRNPSRRKGPNRPVDQVSWKDAVAYCRAVGMRLPSEAEWEYAARGGVSEPRYGDIALIAWFDGNAADQSHEVAKKAPNSFGLYDMLGNLWEWVQDSYGDRGDKRLLR